MRPSAAASAEPAREHQQPELAVLHLLLLHALRHLQAAGERHRPRGGQGPTLPSRGSPGRLAPTPGLPRPPPPHPHRLPQLRSPGARGARPQEGQLLGLRSHRHGVVQHELRGLGWRRRRRGAGGRGGGGMDRGRGRGGEGEVGAGDHPCPLQPQRHGRGDGGWR